MRKLLLLFVFALILVMGSCASKKGAKKCNGQKGVKTNMGVM